MIPFRTKKALYRAQTKALNITARILPFPRPTLFSGPGSSLELCETIALMGIRNVLIVTDAMLIEIGLTDPIQNKLSELGVDFVIYDGVKPDPTIDQIEEGLAMLRQHGCEAVFGIGGGSSLDAAKVIAARATNDKPIRKMEGFFRLFRTPLPLYTVPTTAGTGSEVTVAAIVSDPMRKSKAAIVDPKLVPDLAALDANLMTGLPPHITAATSMDALTHAVEAYLSLNALPGTDHYALAATRLIMKNLPIVMQDGQNVEARQRMALASFYAALAFTRSGVGYVHAIAHALGARYHTPHGLANAIVMPYVLEYSRPACSARMAALGEASGLRAAGDSDATVARKFIDHVRGLNAALDIPDKLDTLEIADIPDIARAALKEAHGTYAVPRFMDAPTCEAVIHDIAGGPSEK